MSEEKKQQEEVPVNPKVLQLMGWIQGLTRSRFNVVMFTDKPEVWMQYYMGLYLENETIVVIKKEDKKRFHKRFKDKLVREIIDVTDFSQNTVDRVAKRIEIISKLKI